MILRKYVKLLMIIQWKQISKLYPSNFLYLGNLFYFFILGFASIVFGKIKFFEINLYAISIVLLIQIL